MSQEIAQYWKAMAYEPLVSMADEEYDSLCHSAGPQMPGLAPTKHLAIL